MHETGICSSCTNGTASPLDGHYVAPPYPLRTGGTVFMHHVFGQESNFRSKCNLHVRTVVRTDVVRALYTPPPLVFVALLVWSRSDNREGWEND